MTVVVNCEQEVSFAGAVLDQTYTDSVFLYNRDKAHAHRI